MIDIRRACGLYVDLRLGLVDGVDHSVDSALHLVAKTHGTVAAKAAAHACDNRPVEQVIEARKDRPDDFRKPNRNPRR